MKQVSQVALALLLAFGLLRAPLGVAAEPIDPPAADHWAFQPVESHVVPKVQRTDWASSPIDRFILAALEAERMSPAEPANRTTLIRRATFDLIGLPPSPDEVAAFVANRDADAFAKVVDRLLDSPLYGQRWGRYWLDVARYADTKGYVRLKEERRFHHAFTYRDWVIRAFNEDLPYDRFVELQLAADLLPPSPDNRDLAALGFLTLGRQFTGNKYDIIDDRIDVVTRGLLGLSVSCARCHDHMYDPIPTADYYSLYGVFETSEEPVIPPLVGPVASDAATQDFQREFEKLKAALDEYEPVQYAALVNEFRRRSAEYLVAAAEGFVPLQQPLPKTSADVRQVVVNRWIDFISRSDQRDPVFGAWHALAQLKSDEFAGAAAQLVEKWKSGDDASGVPINALVPERLARQPLKSMADVARAYGELFAEVHQRWQTLSSATAAAGGGALERLTDVAEEHLRQVLYAPDSPVAVSRQLAFEEYLYDAPIHDEITKRRLAINQHLCSTAHAPARAHTLVESPVQSEPRIFVRGNPGRPGRSVPRQFLSVLACGESKPKQFDAASSRLDLARAIVDRDNPLMVRVLVNRIWAHHFGAGLVRSPSNFGLRGQPPTHPDLLDYLARRFTDEGWSIKKLHRWIMLTSVYQQSSRDHADYAARDPENRLLWKMNRRRLDFESLRDSLLAAAGRLDTTSSGPGFDLAAPGANRRTVYALVDRQALPGMLPTFDFASPDAHSPERHATTVPQQALLLMNSPLVTDAAKAFAARADVKGIANPADRVARLIELAWGRAASEREIKQAVEFVTADESAATAGSFDAWESLAQTLLLANEFMYVE